LHDRFTVWVGSHARPHAPQFIGSVAVFVHPPLLVLVEPEVTELETTEVLDDDEASDVEAAVDVETALAVITPPPLPPRPPVPLGGGAACGSGPGHLKAGPTTRSAAPTARK
jgi:hypothetical protein